MNDVPPPRLEFEAHLEVTVGDVLDVGHTGGGVRRIVPITGGTVSGPLLRGQVLPGGADHQLVQHATVSHLEARYVIESDRGELVYVVNNAVRVASAEDTARMLRGEPVDPDRVYFRSTPRFETAASRLADLGRRVHVATGTRRPNAVVLDVFAVC